MTSEVLDGVATTYQYDTTNQLTDDDTTAYSYDANGNRTMSGYEVGANNRLLSDGTWDYSHDDEGNRTEKADPSTGDTWWYSYDNANRLVLVEYAQVPPVGPYVVSDIATFVYDVFGNRIHSEIDADGVGGSPSVVTQFAYDGPHVWADLDDAGSLTTRRIFGDAIDQLFARIEDEELDWYGTDRLGSVRFITDSSGAVLDQIDYDGFGNTIGESNPSNGDRYQWTGREFEEAIGLYHYPYRPFDPQTARFLTEDPIGFGAGDTNLGRYAGNNPTNFTDPLGLEALGVGEYGPELLSPGSSYQPSPAVSSNLPPLSSSPLDGVDLSPLLPADLTVQFPENNLGPLAIGEGRQQRPGRPAWQEGPRRSLIDRWNDQLRSGQLRPGPERGNDVGWRHTQSQPGLVVEGGTPPGGSSAFGRGVGVVVDSGANIVQGKWNPTAVAGVKDFPRAFKDGLYNLLAVRGYNLVRLRFSPKAVAGFQEFYGRGKGLVTGHFSPASRNGWQVIVDGRAIDVGAVTLRQPPKGLENQIPIYNGLRRSGVAYYQNDGKGIINNFVMALGDYVAMRSLTQGGKKPAAGRAAATAAEESFVADAEFLNDLYAAQERVASVARTRPASLFPEGYIGAERQLTYTPTTRTLSQVRNQPHPGRWQAGEQFAQELYGSSGQRAFPTPFGDRFPDAPVNLPNGGVLGLEVKTYGQWTTVAGVARQQTVPLTAHIRQQILKDVWLRRNVPGYDPRWEFLGAPPSSELATFLRNKRIVSISE